MLRNVTAAPLEKAKTISILWRNFRIITMSLSIMYIVSGISYILLKIIDISLPRPVVCNSQNRGRSKKSQGRTALKNRGGSLAVGSYLQKRQYQPPPPPGATDPHPHSLC